MRGTVRVVVIAATLVGLCLVPACGGGGGSTGPTTPAPLVTPPPDYSGNWEGAVRYSGQQLPMSFQVGGQQVTSFWVDLWVTMGAWPNQATCQYRFSSKVPAPLSGGSFEIPVETTSGFVYRTTVRGSFSSSAAASGTVDAFSVTGGVCRGLLVFGTGFSQSSQRWEAVEK